MSAAFEMTPVRATHKRIPLDQIAPNPRHARLDWEVHDKDLEDLARSMEWNGQLVYCRATPVDPARDPDLADAGRTVMLIDGHRRLVVAHLLDMPTLKVEVDSFENGETGRSISPATADLHWLTIQMGQKRPSPYHILVCLARIRVSWEEESDEPFPESVRVLGRMTGVSRSTVSRYRWILDGPIGLCKAFANGHIPGDAAELIIREASDPDHLEALGRYIASWNALDAGQLTLEEIQEHISPKQQEVHLVRSPLIASSRLVVPARPERNLVAEIVQQLRRLVDLRDEARSGGVSLPLQLGACLDLIAEDQIRQYLDECDTSSPAQETQAGLDGEALMVVDAN